MSIEERARNIVANELSMQVVVHDNGSKPGMYDLIIGPVSAPEYAIECVGAVDPVATETWNIGPGKGPIKINSSRNWIVEIKKTSNIKLLKNKISEVIWSYEASDLKEHYAVDWYMERRNPEIFNKLDRLGITYISMSPEEGSGVVHLTMEGGGGPYHDNGDDVAKWIGDFLNSPNKADVVKKLAQSGAKEKHAFILLDLDGAPWEVESYFYGDMNLPRTAPKLPEPITGAWVVRNGKGLRYMQGQWHVFSYESA